MRNVPVGGQVRSQIGMEMDSGQWLKVEFIIGFSFLACVFAYKTGKFVLQNRRGIIRRKLDVGGVIPLTPLDISSLVGKRGQEIELKLGM